MWRRRKHHITWKFVIRYDLTDWDRHPKVGFSKDFLEGCDAGLWSVGGYYCGRKDEIVVVLEGLTEETTVPALIVVGHHELMHWGNQRMKHPAMWRMSRYIFGNRMCNRIINYMEMN